MRISNKTASNSAFTGLEMIAVVAVVAFLLIYFWLPTLSNPRHGTPQTACINNLRQTGTAFRMWAEDNSDRYPMQFVGTTNYPQLRPAQSWIGGPRDYSDAFLYFKLMSNVLNTPKIIVCPSDSRSAATNFALLQNTNVSFFVGQDADQANPNMILAGDRNVELDAVLAQTGMYSVYPTNIAAWSPTTHKLSGNVTLADGSAQKLNCAQLQQYLLKTGTNVNRLVFP
jgi:hypothetical protein